MIGPIDAIVAIHNAFRADMAAIDAAALAAARGTPGLEATVERFRFFNEVLEWHAHGEELAVFPALEAVAPLVAEAYEMDHRGLDRAFDALSDAVSVHDTLQTARATAAFKFHLDIHLAKEDAHLYRIIRERVSVPDQGKAVGVMAGDRAPRPQPGVDRVDVPAARRRRPREHDPHLADGDAAGSLRGRDPARPPGDRRRLHGTESPHPRAGGVTSMSPNGVRRDGSGRPSAPVPEPLRRVGDDFEDEYPGASALATECFANLFHAGNLLMELHDRHTREKYQLSPSARQVLAVVEGAGEPLEPSVIADACPHHEGLHDLDSRHPRKARAHPTRAPTPTTAADFSWKSPQTPRQSSTSCCRHCTPANAR